MPDGKQMFWSLPQTAAWVVFRSSAVVNRFPPAGVEDWTSFWSYPTRRSELREIGTISGLVDSLKDGRITAFGRRNGGGGSMEAIPSIEWMDMVFDVDGPYRRLPSGAKFEPWSGFVVKRADAEKLWRGVDEVESRSKYDKAWFQKRYIELRGLNPDFSDNKLINELCLEYVATFKRKEPARTTLQRYIKGL